MLSLSHVTCSAAEDGMVGVDEGVEHQRACRRIIQTDALRRILGCGQHARHRGPLDQASHPLPTSTFSVLVSRLLLVLFTAAGHSRSVLREFIALEI